MQTLTDIGRWILHDRLDWSCVVLSAVVAAWLDRVAHRRRTPGYDAWWFHNIDPSDPALRRAARGEQV
jgi:hypothetical protein